MPFGVTRKRENGEPGIGWVVTCSVERTQSCSSGSLLSHKKGGENESQGCSDLPLFRRVLESLWICFLSVRWEWQCLFWRTIGKMRGNHVNTKHRACDLVRALQTSAFFISKEENKVLVATGESWCYWAMWLVCGWQLCAWEPLALPRPYASLSKTWEKVLTIMASGDWNEHMVRARCILHMLLFAV